MRPARTPVGIALVLALSLTAHAQNLPYQATVVVSEAEVRSGPGLDPKLYPTNKLRRGDTVQVVQERSDGWLAIQPPPGSFSWINTRFLKRENPTTWSVVTDPNIRVPVRIGSQVLNAPPTVQQVTLPRGALVVSVGEPEAAVDGTLLPIVPPSGEVRYLRAETVKGTSFVQVASPQSGPLRPASPAPLAPPSPVPTPPPPAAQAPARTDALWLQAERAEQGGNIPEAEELYTRCADQTSDYDLRIACFNRLANLYRLKQGQRNALGPQVRLTGASAPGAGTEGRLVPTPVSPPVRAGVPPGLPAPTTSEYGSAPVAPLPGRPTAVPAPSPQPVPRGSGPGWLRRTAFYVDNKPAYRMESDQGQPLMYVTAGPGVDLERFVGRNVDLYGPVSYRGDLRTNYMTVTQVFLLR